MLLFWRNHDVKVGIKHIIASFFLCHIGLNSAVDTFTIYAESDLLAKGSSQINDKLLSFVYRARTEISVEVC